MSKPSKKVEFTDEKWAIPKDVLRRMASVCTEDTEEIYQRLLNNYIAKDERFRILILSAAHNLGWSKMDGWKKEKREGALNELKKIKKAAVTLNKLLPRIDFSRFPPAGSLEERMYNFLGADVDSNKYKSNLDSWHAFQETLGNQIKIYDDFEKFIKKGARNGRYNVLAGLKEFIYQIALLYTETTGNAFTVDKLARGKDGAPPAPVTDGMAFANQSLEAIYCVFPYRFTPANFQSACDAVSKRLRHSEKQ